MIYCEYPESKVNIEFHNHGVVFTHQVDGDIVYVGKSNVSLILQVIEGEIRVTEAAGLNFTAQMDDRFGLILHSLGGQSPRRFIDISKNELPRLFSQLQRMLIGSFRESGTAEYQEVVEPLPMTEVTPVWTPSVADQKVIADALIEAEDADLLNPKDVIGTTKVPMDMLPEVAMIHGSLGMLEGALKYGKHNYRFSPVKASIYIAAAMRHLLKFANGQDRDPKTTIKELGSVIANAAILLDAEAHGTLIDDRTQTNVVEEVLAEEMSTVEKLKSLFGTDTRLLGDRK